MREIEKIMREINEGIKLVLVIAGVLFLFWFVGFAISSHENDLKQRKVNGHAIECINGITYFVESAITPQVDQNNKPVLCNF